MIGLPLFGLFHAEKALSAKNVNAAPQQRQTHLMDKIKVFKVLPFQDE
jgi:hypothetical protein